DYYCAIWHITTWVF
nr:immunoglobulin light chain junction region [Macaca mulatta]